MSTAALAEDRGGMHSTAVPSTHDQLARRRPRWWWVALVQLGGTYAAGVLAIVAWFSLPDHGLFGVPNDDGTQAMGALAAVGSVACLLSGPIFVALVRRDRRSLRTISWITGGLTFALLAALTG